MSDCYLELCSDDDGFFLACKDLRGRFDKSFPACTFFFLCGDLLACSSSAL